MARSLFTTATCFMLSLPVLATACGSLRLARVEMPTEEAWERMRPAEIAEQERVARLALARGEDAPAADRLEHIYQWRVRTEGADAPQTIEAACELGDVLSRMERQPDAISLLNLCIGHRWPSDPYEEVEFADTIVRARARAHTALGQYRMAEADYQSIVDVFRRQLGPNHMNVARLHNDLGVLYTYQGRYQEAEDILAPLLVRYRDLLGPEESETITTLNNLGVVYRYAGNAERAAHTLQEVVRIREQHAHADAESLELSINNLALALTDAGREQAAAERMEQLSKQHAARLGPDHPTTLTTDHNLAAIYASAQRLAEAQALTARVLDVRIQTLGWPNPGTMYTARLHARLVVTAGQTLDAVNLSRELARAEERHLRRNLVGSEQSRQAFFDTFQASTDFILSLHLDHAPDNPEALKLAAETWLRRKGRILEAQADTLAALRHQLDGEGTDLLSTLQQLRRQEASLVQLPIEQGPKDRLQRLDALARDIAETERQMATKSHAFAAQTAPVTLQTVQDALPKGAALLQYAVYTPFSLDEDESPKPHLAAYILHKDGRLSGTNLGPLAAEAKPIEAFRQTRNPTLAAMLHTKLLAPLAHELQGVDHLFVSPDGPLHLLPFEALLDAEGTPLLARQSLSYLDNGRDLLRYTADRPDVETTAPLVLANPTFGSGWVPLPGTAAEADVLHTRYPDAVVHTGAAATVSALRDVHSPRFLHIATHGFFEANDPHTLVDENPMARSGLVLSGEDDARLLATEAATLDLHGTALAVLSACETGLGEASGGEGVYGIRRALAMAGVESQVVSLWKVDDAATAAFMTGFHDRLLAGQERSEAMRQTKLAMREADAEADAGRMEWAAFVLAGEWR